MKTSFTKSALAGAALSVLSSGAMANHLHFYSEPELSELYDAETMKCIMEDLRDAAIEAYSDMELLPSVVPSEMANLSLLSLMADVQASELEHSIDMLREALSTPNASRTDIEKRALGYAKIMPAYNATLILVEAKDLAKEGLLTFDIDTVTQNCQPAASIAVPEYTHP